MIAGVRCAWSRMCSLCSRPSTGVTAACPGRRQSCSTSGRRCCWRRRSTLTSTACDAARTRLAQGAYSSRYVLAGCEYTPRRRRRASSPGTTSANCASTLVLSFPYARRFQFLALSSEHAHVADLLQTSQVSVGPSRTSEAGYCKWDVDVLAV